MNKLSEQAEEPCLAMSNRLEELVIWCNSADAYEMSFDNLENGIYLLNGLLDKKNQHT